MEPGCQQESSLYPFAQTSYLTVLNDFSLPPMQTPVPNTGTMTGPVSFSESRDFISLGSADPSFVQS